MWSVYSDITYNKKKVIILGSQTTDIFLLGLSPNCLCFLSTDFFFISGDKDLLQFSRL